MSCSVSFISARCCVCLFLYSMIMYINGNAQVGIQGGTPEGLTPGSPVGAYKLNGIEDINIFSGQTNISIPLITIGGRGEASYTATLRISPDPWLVLSGTVS